MMYDDEGDTPTAEHYTGHIRGHGLAWHIVRPVGTESYQVRRADAYGLPHWKIADVRFSLADAQESAEKIERPRIMAARRKAALRALRTFAWNTYRYGNA